VKIFLIHGMGRTPASMWLLGYRLGKAGHQPFYFGYTVTFEALPAIADRFVARVKEVVEEGEAFAVVGHSLGNLITRLAFPALPSHFSHFVQLAPPNQPPATARMLKDVKLFKAITKDTGNKLQDADFFKSLPIPEAKTLIIAGNAGPRLDWLPFKGVPNDGILAVGETRIPDIELVEVPAMHTFIMNRGDVAAMIAEFVAG
jgi:alpha-beta hydrolase superfamily lysophospholipase